MKKKEAYDLTIFKWEFIVEGNFDDPLVALGTLFKAYPHIKLLRNSCGYCEHFLIDGEGLVSDCENCPLYKLLDKECEDKGAPYYNWRFAANSKTAQAMLDAIKESKNI